MLFNFGIFGTENFHKLTLSCTFLFFTFSLLLQWSPWPTIVRKNRKQEKRKRHHLPALVLLDKRWPAAQEPALPVCLPHHHYHHYYCYLHDEGIYESFCYLNITRLYWLPRTFSRNPLVLSPPWTYLMRRLYHFPPTHWASFASPWPSFTDLPSLLLGPPSLTSLPRAFSHPSPLNDLPSRCLPSTSSLSLIPSTTPVTSSGPLPLATLSDFYSCTPSLLPSAPSPALVSITGCVWSLLPPGCSLMSNFVLFGCTRNRTDTLKVFLIPLGFFKLC